MAYYLQAFSGGSQLQNIEISFNDSGILIKKIHTPAGSQGVIISLKKDKQLVQQAEVLTPFGVNEIEVCIEIQDDHALTIKFTSGDNPIHYLPTKELRAIPKQLIFPDNTTNQLEVLFLIDGTMLSHEEDKRASNSTLTKLMLKNKKESENISQSISTLLNQFQKKYSDIKYSILLFGDCIPNKKFFPKDLQPSYELREFSGDGYHFKQWHPHEEEMIKSELIKNGGSQGGDYVDALAEAMNASYDKYNWSGGVRKLLFIIGDSPGFSLINPTPVIQHTSANIGVRLYDVDSEALALNLKGIEIATLFINQKNVGACQSDDYESADPKNCLSAYTENQYKQIASIPDYVLSGMSNIMISRFGNTFLEMATPISKGYSYPII